MAGKKWQNYVKILENNNIVNYRDVVDVEVTLTARQQKSKSQKTRLFSYNKQTASCPLRNIYSIGSFLISKKKPGEAHGVAIIGNSIRKRSPPSRLFQSKVLLCLCKSVQI
jgi:hypothetical protein